MKYFSESRSGQESGRYANALIHNGYRRFHVPRIELQDESGLNESRTMGLEGCVM
jgi:hypothetical protein